MSIADEFRAKFLDSNDKDDKTEQEPDWRDQKVRMGFALLII